MSGPYARLHQSFWRSPLATSIPGPDAVYVWLYLSSAPEQTMTGIVYAPAALIAEETQLSLARVQEALSALSAGNHVISDARCRWHYVRSYFRDQIGELKSQDNRAKAFVQQASSLAVSVPDLLASFSADYPAAWALVADRPIVASDEPVRAKGLPKPLPEGLRETLTKPLLEGLSKGLTKGVVPLPHTPSPSFSMQKAECITGAHASESLESGLTPPSEAPSEGTPQAPYQAPMQGASEAPSYPMPWEPSPDEDKRERRQRLSQVARLIDAPPEVLARIEAGKALLGEVNRTWQSQFLWRDFGPELLFALEQQSTGDVSLVMRYVARPQAPPRERSLQLICADPRTLATFVAQAQSWAREQGIATSQGSPSSAAASFERLSHRALVREHPVGWIDELIRRLGPDLEASEWQYLRSQRWLPEAAENAVRAHLGRDPLPPRDLEAESAMAAEALAKLPPGWRRGGNGTVEPAP